MLSPHAQRILYHAQISSNILYGLGVWGCMACQQDLNKLQSIQSQCVSLINCHKTTAQNYQEGKILRISDQITLEMCKLWHKHYLGELPHKLSDEMAHDHKKESLGKKHEYNTRKKHLQIAVLAKCKQYSSSFLVKGNIAYSKHTTLMSETNIKRYGRKLKHILLMNEKY